MGKLLSRKNVIGGLVGAGVLSAALAAPAVAFADDSATPAPSPSASASADNGTAKPGQRGADRRAELAKELATELGVPQDKVEAALAKLRQQHQADHRGDRKPGDKGGWQRDGKSPADREAWLKSRLDKAVTDGKLTREQADAILAAVKAGVLPGGWGGFGHGGGQWGADAKPATPNTK